LTLHPNPKPYTWNHTP